MITVYTIQPHHAGFGMFDRHTDGVDHPDLNTVEDYVEFVRENAEVDPITEDDDDFEKVRDADGKIYNQNGGTVIGWKDRRTEEFQQMELVCLS